jgi:hypothetical protein
MVRLVFRPYTQVRRTICTSVSLRASTRVSSGFALLRHSSPSFGSQQVCSHSNPSHKLKVGRRCTPRKEGISPVSFLAPRRFSNPPTRTHVRLLGPCFKTGRMESPPTNTTSAQVHTARHKGARFVPRPPHRQTDRRYSTRACDDAAARVGLHLKSSGGPA